MPDSITQHETWKKTMDLGMEGTTSPSILYWHCAIEFLPILVAITLFTRNKIYLDDIQKAISRCFAHQPIDLYRSGIKSLQTRWQKVVDNEDNYIIG